MCPNKRTLLSALFQIVNISADPDTIEQAIKGILAGHQILFKNPNVVVMEGMQVEGNQVIITDNAPFLETERHFFTQLQHIPYMPTINNAKQWFAALCDECLDFTFMLTEKPQNENGPF